MLDNLSKLEKKNHMELLWEKTVTKLFFYSAYLIFWPAYQWNNANRFYKAFIYKGGCLGDDLCYCGLHIFFSILPFFVQMMNVNIFRTHTDAIEGNIYLISNWWKTWKPYKVLFLPQHTHRYRKEKVIDRIWDRSSHNCCVTIFLKEKYFLS